MNKMPSDFEMFNDAKRKGFLEAKSLKEEGKNIVGLYCAFSPTELIMAAGAIPISLCGTSEETIPASESHLPRNLCPLIKSSYGAAITDSCPYFYFADLILGETTCDGKKKMFEYLGEIKPMHVMQLPQTNKGERALNFWREEIEILKEKLEEQFHVQITEEKIIEAIKSKNKERTIIREFYELGKMSPPLITGKKMFQILYGSGFKFDKKEQNKTIKKITEEIKKSEHITTLKDSPRILITGCPIGGDTEKVIDIIEESGAVVVCFENCSGVKPNEELVDETGDPITALARKYLNIPCSVMTPNEKRLEILSKLIDEYRVDGVVEVILQGCHTYSVESYGIKRFIKDEKNTPYILLETDYSSSDTGQLKTRIGAFIEML